MENLPLIYQWHIDVATILLIAVLVYFYHLISGFKRNEKSVLFWIAIFFFLIAQCSPLHYLGMHFYFSAHMVSHIIILLLCGPLLVLSLKPKATSGKSSAIKSLSVFMNKYSFIGWLAGVGIMWFWHIPAIFDASFSHMKSVFSIFPLLHGGTMLFAGMLFSWPLFSPYKNTHIHPLLGIVYLFTACISCSLLGLLITFAPLNTYHHYLSMNQGMNMAGAKPWDIPAESDQQAAGLIMWVPCCFVYLSGCIYLFQKWFSGDDAVSNNPVLNLNSQVTHEQ